MNKDKIIISVIGLGYVGLPLAIEFGKKFKVIGFDIKKKRILELKKKIDVTKEVTELSFNSSKYLFFTNKEKELVSANIYILTVPTPIKENNKPDLSYIFKACDVVLGTLKIGNIIVLESTVFPGFCEEILAPYIEKKSGFKYNKDFFIGYSPERINPGDSKYKIKNIIKIVSASDIQTLRLLCKIYKKIIPAGIYRAKNIKIAESAKVIENIQRDINVAFMNELAMIFNKMKIDTLEVLKAASTKWNFLKFYPGLVGGHCIGVDPYYLTYKCNQIGYRPNLILASRKINNYTTKYISENIIRKFKGQNNIKGLILGASFKENCPDIRNSGSSKIFSNLKRIYTVEVYDPIASENDCKRIYKKAYIKKLKKNYYDFIIIAVGHKIFKQYGFNKIKNLSKENSYIVDVKSIFKKSESNFRL